MSGLLSQPITMAVVVGAITFIPLLALLATSYLKIVIVLGLVRNALGVQQVPPNLVLTAIALILTAYIMAPVGHRAWTAVQDSGLVTEPPSAQRLARAADGVRQPVAAFLERHTPDADRAFFVEASVSLWAGSGMPAARPDSLLVLVPAFTLRELTQAFQIGFVLYLAFIAVDLIVATVLQALGLAMLSPTPIAIPFKLLLFVAFDGWQKLIHALVLSYA